MDANGIVLTAGMRDNIFFLNDTSRLVSKAQERLATGKSVNSALDNPTNFFAAKANLQRAGDLLSFKEGIGDAIQAVKTSMIAIDKITSILEQATVIVENAKLSKNAREVAKYAQMFNEIRSQLDMLSADASYKGKNLLHREDLAVYFGNNNFLTIKGTDITSNGFGQVTSGLNIGAVTAGTDKNAKNTNLFASVENGRADVISTAILQETDVSKFWESQPSKGSNSFTLERALSANASVVKGTASISSTSVYNDADVYQYLGQMAGSGSKSVELFRDVTAGAAVAGNPAAVTSTSIQDESAVINFLGALAGAGSNSFSLSRGISLSSSVGSSTGSISSLSINSSKDIANFIGPQDNGASNSFLLTYSSATHSWSSPGFNITNSGGVVKIDMAGNGTSVTADLAGTWSTGDTITINTTAGSWKSNNPSVGVAVSGTDLNLDINGDGSTDINISLAGPLQVDAAINVDTAATAWKTTDPSVSLVANGTTLGLDLNRNGSTDVKIDLNALAKADVRLSATSILNDWYSSAHPEISIHPAETELNINLGLDAKDDINVTLDSLLNGDVKINVFKPTGSEETNIPYDRYINRKADARHNWLAENGTTPNTYGMSLSQSEIEDAITTLRLNSAINLSSLSILTTRNDFIINLAHILEAGSDNLTLADMNQESANILMLQAREHLSVTSLRLSSQAAQNVMRLF